MTIRGGLWRRNHGPNRVADDDSFAVRPAFAQEQVAAADRFFQPQPRPSLWSADELEVRWRGLRSIRTSLSRLSRERRSTPLQIVEAARYLDQYAKDKNLKPRAGTVRWCRCSTILMSSR